MLTFVQCAAQKMAIFGKLDQQNLSRLICVLDTVIFTKRGFFAMNATKVYKI